MNNNIFMLWVYTTFSFIFLFYKVQVISFEHSFKQVNFSHKYLPNLSNHQYEDFIVIWFNKTNNYTLESLVTYI